MTEGARHRATVMVTGARGQLAGAVIDAFAADSDVAAFSRQELDIADPAAVRACVTRLRPDVIVNCAAYNDVDRAEDDPAPALLVNALAVRSLARTALDVDALLVHYSTDFVFDGSASRPYTEEDAPNPRSVYASSKLLGEWFAADAPRALVLRVESLFGGRGSSSVDRIVQGIAEGREVKVFTDRFVSPTYVADAAAATRALVAAEKTGLYHCVNSGYASWYELAVEAARLMGRSDAARLVGVPVDQVPLRAARPKFAALSADKLQGVIAMPSWQDALRRHLT